MGVLRLEKRQNCASGYSWYVCSNNSGFSGCCSIDPCTDSICPAANLGTNLDTLSTASKTTTTATQKTSVVEITTAATTRPTTITSDTTASTSSGASTFLTVQTTTTASSNSILVNEASTRVTTITLNGSTATSLSSSTSVAEANGATQSGKNLGAIVGGVVGGVVFLVLLAIALCLIRRRRHNGSQYGSGNEKPSGPFGLFTGKRSRDSNVNSMASPDSPNQHTGFFGFGLKRRNNDHYRDDAKISGTSDSSPPASSEPLELEYSPALPFDPHQVPGLPRNIAELESDIISARSEPSPLSTPLYRTTRSSGSAWSPSPGLSELSDGSSTGAVLSTRETHYSETSTAAGTPQIQQNSNLRGGGWPGMRPNLNSLRRKPNLPQDSSSAGLAPQDQGRHVLSFMEFNGTGGSENGGVPR